MSTIQEIERAIVALPSDEVKSLRDWIENYLEDEFVLNEEFAAKLERAECDFERRNGYPHARPTTA